MKELVGKRLKHFQIGDRLGTGGMGAVYRAEDLNLHRTVAVKVMHPHLSEQVQFQRRFMQEARAAAGLDHPSIIKIYDFGDEDDLLFMVMQFVAGGSLAAHIEELRKKEQRARLNEILFLLSQVARALDYAHGRGLIHRDVKPDNILVQRLDSPDRQGEPPLRAVVTDFGLAKLLEGGVETVTGTFMGTLPYMSPEQTLGKELDGRSDVYSLGVILYHLATGRLPFDISTPTDAVRKHMYETPPPPASVRPGLPDAVVSIIDTAIAKEPGDRFQSAAEMARAMRAAVDDPAVTESSQAVRADQGVSLLTQLEAMAPAPPSETGEQMPAPEEADRLLVARKDATPQSYIMDRPALTIGRHEDNDVVLPENVVSGKHARLEQTDRGWQVVDLNSTNGTYLNDDRLLADVPEPWEAGQSLRIGPYYMQWQAATVSETPGGRSAYRATELPPEASQVMSASGRLSLIINPERVTVAPGGQAEVQVALVNYGNTVGQFELALEGVPAAWVTLPEEPVGLMPGERAELAVSLHPPKESDARAGEYTLRFIARVAGDDGERTVNEGALTVEAFHGFTAEIAPAHASHGDAVHVSIQNEGNDEAQYVVRGQDPAQAIEFSDRPELTVAPGEEATASLTLTAKERPRFGRGQTLPFTVDVTAGAGAERTFHGQLTVPARYSLGRVVLALFALLFLVPCCAITLFTMADVESLIGTQVTPPAAIPVTEAPAQEQQEFEEVEELQEEAAVPILFSMTVDEVITIRGRGTLLRGEVERGSLREGDDIVITGPGTNIETRVTAIERSGEVVEEASAGEEVGLLVSGLDADEVSPGDEVIRNNDE